MVLKLQVATESLGEFVKVQISGALVDEIACLGQTIFVWSRVEIPGFLTLIPLCIYPILPCYLD